ncbi:MAG: hypothetical protein M3238_00135, partial [Actinomycetota bacterium]|nr:hypothetical protein [Actinomycetota bacterium]
LFQALLQWVRARSTRMSSASYVAVHRLAGAPRLTMLLFAAASVALGIFVHAQTIVRSLETTVDAKAELFVGSDVQAVIRPDYAAPEDFEFPATVVTRFLEAGTIGSGTEVDLLAIDPRTFPSTAYWHEDFGAASLQELMDRLARGGDTGLPAIVAGASQTPSTTYDYLGTQVPIDFVAETSAFPGMASKRPLLVVDRDRLAASFEGIGQGPQEDALASTELWVRGDTARVVGALTTLEDPPYSTVTAEEVKDVPSIAAVIDTFGVLNVLGLGAGLLVVVVILMYLQARQRGRIVSYALSRRMGLTDAGHRGALVAELVVLLVAAYAVGAVLALAAARLIVGMVDPLAAIPPSPLFTFPARLVLWALFALMAIAIAGGITTNARARRADFAEVMRLAD